MKKAKVVFTTQWWNKFLSMGNGMRDAITDGQTGEKRKEKERKEIKEQRIYDMT